MECPGPGWIKVDLHMHSGEDPCDVVSYTARELVDRALELGFGALSITLHKKVHYDPALIAYAAERGLLLIPGVELRLQGSDCVVLNVRPEEVEEVRTFEDLRKLRARRGDDLLTIAPHPFYVLGGSIGRKILTVLDCFDVIEYCHFHTRWLNLNRPAIHLAGKFAKPMVATSDAHRLVRFGNHFSWIQAEKQIGSVFHAIRANKVRCVSPPAGIGDFLEILHYIFIEHPLKCLFKRP